MSKVRITFTCDAGVMGDFVLVPELAEVLMRGGDVMFNVGGYDINNKECPYFTRIMATKSAQIVGGRG